VPWHPAHGGKHIFFMQTTVLQLLGNHIQPLL
jgi:hypothetical protein